MQPHGFTHALEVTRAYRNTWSRGLTSSAATLYRYVSNNVGEVDPANNTEAIFYNCADIKIVGEPPIADSATTT